MMKCGKKSTKLINTMKMMNIEIMKKVKDHAYDGADEMMRTIKHDAKPIQSYKVRVNWGNETYEHHES